MIEGVIIKELQVHKDVSDSEQHQGEKEGFLMEVLREDDDLMKKFGQTVFTVSYPGTIKAFHWHKKQDDLWFISSGTAKIVLYDKREDSKTKGETQVVMAGEDDYKLILIPQGVVHGYQVVGNKPVSLFYHVTEMYDTHNPDEQRIPYDDEEIGFDWGT
jgi:dTDP-4-dehydrorhamnose 3,5-epimerase